MSDTTKVKIKKKKPDADIQVDYGCVLYVDGGCRPGYADDPYSRYGGWGIHGYTYPIGTHPPTKRTKKDIPTIAGYLPGEEVKLESQVVPNGYIDAYGSMSKEDSSDRAELTGFKTAISLIKEKGYKKAHLLLDNQYVINGATEWYPQWVNQNWRKKDGKEYANRTLWEETMSTYYPLKQQVDMTISWVNGHSGNLGNDRADYLATKGVYFGRNGELNKTEVLYSPVSKYRSPEIKLNRLFTKHRWYFNTGDSAVYQAKDGRYIYHCGGHGDDDTLVGKPMADSTACVLLLKEPEPVLDLIRETFKQRIDNPLDVLCVMRLDTVLVPRVYHEILTDGPNVLSIAPRKLNFKGLCTIDNQEVCRIVDPPGLTFKLIDVHNFMHGQLERYLEKPEDCVLTDITQDIYEEVEKKKGKEVSQTYNMKLTPSTKVLRLPVYFDKDKPAERHTCSLTIGIDIPSRELFKAIEERKPKVLVMSWLISPHAFRYAVVVDCHDDTMLWMGKDSNMQFIYPDDMKRKSK